MVFVGQQRDFGSERENAGYLTDKTHVINDRLPGDKRIHQPFVDDNTLGVGIAHGMQNLRDDPIGMLAITDFEQLAQPGVFAFKL